MPDTGWLIPATVTQDTSVGTDTVDNPGNITGTGSTYTTIDWATGEKTGPRLKCTNITPGFPGSVIINGFQVRYSAAKNGSSDNLGLMECHLINSSGAVITAVNSANQVVWNNSNPPTFTEYTLGGATNLMGYTAATQADVEDADFGFSLRPWTTADGINPNTGVTPDGWMNNAAIKIYYSLAPTYKDFMPFFLNL